MLGPVTQSATHNIYLYFPATPFTPLATLSVVPAAVASLLAPHEEITARLKCLTEKLTVVDVFRKFPSSRTPPIQNSNTELGHVVCDRKAQSWYSVMLKNII